MRRLNRNGYLKTIKEWLLLWEDAFWYERIGIVIGILLDIFFYFLLILFWVCLINKFVFGLFF